MIAAGASMIGGIFGGMADSAAAKNRNRAAIQKWITGEMQKGFNNGREHFNAAYSTVQQAERNAAIQRAAYLYQSDSTEALSEQFRFLQGQLSKTYKTARGTLNNQLANTGVTGGTSRALSLSQGLNFYAEAEMAAKNFERTKHNVDREMQNMMNQQTANLFIPNVQLPTPRPEMEDVSFGWGSLFEGMAQGATTMAAYG